MNTIKLVEKNFYYGFNFYTEKKNNLIFYWPSEVHKS